MKPNFVRIKVPELKRYLQSVSVANKRREELLDSSAAVKAHELAIN